MAWSNPVKSSSLLGMWKWRQIKSRLRYFHVLIVLRLFERKKELGSPNKTRKSNRAQEEYDLAGRSKRPFNKVAANEGLTRTLSATLRMLSRRPACAKRFGEGRDRRRQAFSNGMDSPFSKMDSTASTGRIHQHEKEGIHMRQVTRIGIDVAKQVFQLHGVDAQG